MISDSEVSKNMRNIPDLVILFIINLNPLRWYRRIGFRIRRSAEYDKYTLYTIFLSLFVVISPFLPIWQWDFGWAESIKAYVYFNSLNSTLSYVGNTFVWIFFIIFGGALIILLSFFKPLPEKLYERRYNKIIYYSLFLISLGVFFGLLMTAGIIGLERMITAPGIWLVFLCVIIMLVTHIDYDTKEKIRRDYLAYVFIFPTFVLMILIFYVPIFIALFTSFLNVYRNSAGFFDGTTNISNVSLQNYLTLLVPTISQAGQDKLSRSPDPQYDLIAWVLMIVITVLISAYGVYGTWSIKKKITVGGLGLYFVAIFIAFWTSAIYHETDMLAFIGLLFVATVWVVFSIVTAQSTKEGFKRYSMYALSLIPIFVLYFISGIFVNGYNQIVEFNSYYQIYFDPRPMQVFYNSIVWTFGCVIFHITFGLLLAVLMNSEFRGRTVVRALLIVPWAIPSFISITIIGTFIYPTGGGMDIIFGWFKLAPYDWYNTNNFLGSAIIVNIFLGYSFTMVAFLAALQSVNKELYEAAELDGANGWQKFRSITLPIIKPVVVITTILGFMWTFNMFNVVYLLARPYTSTLRPKDYVILVVYIFNLFTSGTADNFSYASTVSFVLFILLIVFVKAFTKATGKGPYDLDAS